MSVLYHFSVREAEQVKLPAAEIIDYCYDAMSDNFRTDVKNYNIDVTQEPKKIGSDRFVTLMEEMVKREKIIDYQPLLSKLYHLNESHLEEFRDSVKEDEVNKLSNYRILMWNNLFAQLLEKEEDVVDVLKLRLEIASIHPDAGFPRYRMNAKATKNDERRFLIRVLSDIYNNNSENPIEKWFGNRNGNANEMNVEAFDSSSLLWGFKREKKSLKIKPKSASFWKKNKDSWWAEGLQEYLLEDSDNKPYEVVTYDVIIHPKWFRDYKTIVSEIYESTAHWM